MEDKEQKHKREMDEILDLILNGRPKDELGALKDEIRRLWHMGCLEEMRLKLYAMDREDLEELMYRTIEDDDPFDMLVEITGVHIQTDPEKTQEEIARLNEAARKFLEIASKK